MRPVEAIEIPAGQTVTLQPGGFHLMLIGLKEPLIQGQAVPVTLRFERAGEVPVMLAVQPAGARGPMPHGH
jgi:copper(I)-binding protein